MPPNEPTSKPKADTCWDIQLLSEQFDQNPVKGRWGGQGVASAGPFLQPHHLSWKPLKTSTAPSLSEHCPELSNLSGCPCYQNFTLSPRNDDSYEGGCDIKRNKYADLLPCSWDDSFHHICLENAQIARISEGIQQLVFPNIAAIEARQNLRCRSTKISLTAPWAC